VTTETIDIRIREDGSRVVKANMEGMAASMDKAAGSLDFLRRALELVAGAYAVDKLRQYADAWASATGLIQVATKSVEEAAAVQGLLFQAAQHTRTGFTDMAELYARAARAGTELGASQEQIINFTEGVGKALVIQHTSATQASGALLQLGQLLGTGKVHAQEFNSVNEQLAVVLQTVAKHVQGADGSIAKLRKQMLDGQLTSKQFFDAFLAGAKDLEGDFQKSSATIGQGLTVLNNAMTKFVGELDHSIGFSNAFGKAANAIASNMDAIKDAVVRLTIVLGTAAAAWATYTAVQAASNGATALGVTLQYISAIARGTAVALNSTTAEAARAAALLATAQATEAATAAQNAALVQAAGASATLAEAQAVQATATLAAINASRSDATAKLAQINADLRSAQAMQAAAASAGAQSYALAALRTATADVAAAEQARNVVLGELAVLGQQAARASATQAAAMGAQATAQEALTAATAGAAGANAAAAASTAAAVERSAAASAKAAAGATLFGQALTGLKNLFGPLLSALGKFFLFLNANPFTVVITALVVVTGLLLGFGDKISAGVDDVTTMRDVLTALGQDLKDMFAPLGSLLDGVWESIKSGLGGITGAFGDLDLSFAGVLRGIARTFDAIGGLLTGIGIGIYRAFAGVPDIVSNQFHKAYNAVVGALEDIVNAAISAVNRLREAMGKPLIDAVKFDKLPVDEDAWSKYTADVAKAIGDGFDAQGGYLEGKVNGLLDRASQVARGRLAKESGFRPPTGVDLSKPTKPAAPPGIDPKEAAKAATALRNLLNSLVPSEGAALDLAHAEQILNEAHAKLGLSTADVNRYMDIARRHYADIIDPMGKYMRDIQTQTRLLGLSADARQTEAEVVQVDEALKQQGIYKTEDEIAVLRRAIQARNDYARVVAAEDNIIASTVNRRRDFVDQLTAINNLLNDPKGKGAGFTKGDAAEVLASQNPELLQGTQLMVDGVVNQYRRMYDKIGQLRARPTRSTTQARRNSRRSRSSLCTRSLCRPPPTLRRRG
jgi:tape measure domain-containing protein